MWNQKIQETSEYNKKEADSDIGNKVVITSGEREGGVGQRVQTFSYKMNKFWRSSVQHDDFS